MSAPVVSITVVAYNSDHCLRDCLESCRPALASGLAELIVVDNASPDDSAGIVGREFPDATLLRSASNLGFAGGCNLAWRHLRGRYWLLLNPDVTIPADGLQRLVAWMEQRPELGAASPELVDGRGRRRFTARRFPTLRDAVLELTRLHLLIPSAQRARLLLGTYWGGGQDVDADWIPAAALLIRREAIESVGLLSESLWMYGEDIEWCWRLRRRGWRLGVCGSIQFTHLEGASAGRTWNPSETRARTWSGFYAACRDTRGSVFSRALMAINTLALSVEYARRRADPDVRQRLRGDVATHLGLLRRRSLRALGAAPVGRVSSAV